MILHIIFFHEGQMDNSRPTSRSESSESTNKETFRIEKGKNSLVLFCCCNLDWDMCSHCLFSSILHLSILSFY